MDNSVEDYFQILEKYKHLKRTDVSDIPDNELENAVMSWMWNKFDETWSDQLCFVSSLPLPCQNVYSCRTVSDEINNGGFPQLFHNETGQFAEMSVGGFVALGSLTLSGLMAKALILFRHNQKLFESYFDGTLEGFLNSYQEGIFDELEELFYKSIDTIDYISYIRLHSESFGD